MGLPESVIDLDIEQNPTKIDKNEKDEKFSSLESTLE